jgi:hypothetical protein
METTLFYDAQQLSADIHRMVAKVEWHLGELYPRVGFIVTNLSRPLENVVAFYNPRDTCEQWIKEGKLHLCETRTAMQVLLELMAALGQQCRSAVT